MLYLFRQQYQECPVGFRTKIVCFEEGVRGDAFWARMDMMSFPNNAIQLYITYLTFCSLIRFAFSRSSYILSDAGSKS